VDVATEHHATNFLRFYLLAWLYAGAPSFRINPVLLACAPGELHEGSLLMFGVLLRRLRWPVEYLGQAVSPTSFSAFLEDLTPAAIVFVAMSEEAARALLQWPKDLPKAVASCQPFVYFGGRAFVEHPELIGQMEGEYLGDTLEEGVERLNARLHQAYSLISA
jgi:hypothetical protein